MKTIINIENNIYRIKEIIEMDMNEAKKSQDKKFIAYIQSIEIDLIKNIALLELLKNNKNYINLSKEKEKELKNKLLAYSNSMITLLI